MTELKNDEDPREQPICYCCGEKYGSKVTERGDRICVDCDDYYAIGGPGEFEIE